MSKTIFIDTETQTWADGSTYNPQDQTIQVRDNSGNIIYTMTPTGITSFKSPYSPMSPEEAEQLKALNQEHKEKIREEQLNLFKKSAKEVRQFIVNLILTKKLAVDMSNVRVEKSDAHKELENKDIWQPKTLFSGFNYSNKTVIHDIVEAFGFPDLLTEDDLLKAHIEASLEEDMLGK